MAVPVQKEVEKDHDFFTQMLDLIPTNFYFDSETKKLLRDDVDTSDSEAEEEEKPAAKKPGNNKRQAEELSLGNNKRQAEELSLKAKWKRAKFDPAQIKTVSQMTQEIVQKQAEAKGPKQKTKKPKNANEAQLANGGKPKPDPNAVDTPESLREKLKAKITLLKEKRHALDRKDEYQKRRLKRNEKKAKKKFKQKQEKNQKSVANGPLTPKPKAPVVSKPVFNKEGKMVFSKFDFSEQKQAKPAKKSFKNLLEKAQKEKEKVEKLKETDVGAAKNLKQKQQWQSVLQKAEGIKVKDNPELIKKAMKMREKMKDKSKKAWGERVEIVETKMKQRQDKRKSNIKKKKDNRINNKITKAKKKGRIMPGF